MDDDLILLLVVSSEPQSERYSRFSKKQGFITEVCPTPDASVSILMDRKKDLILFDAHDMEPALINTGLDKIVQNTAHQNVPIFLVLKSYPESETRIKLLQNGCREIFTAPFTQAEIKIRYKVFQDNLMLNQECRAWKDKYQASVQYLDNFKADLKTIKSDLFDERTALNNALKQINQLARERSRLKKEKKGLKTELKTNMDGFSSILVDLTVSLLEKNRGHSERVAHIAAYTGERFNLTEKQLEDLRKAAMLHEIGLLFVPIDTLNKTPDQLSDYEKDLYLQFPMKGAKLLEKCSRFKGCAKIIESMNENADGTGYPKGLKKRYIPVSSRILAGADVFDTLKDDHRIKDLEGFLVSLEGYSGTRLDPKVVSALEKYAVLHLGSDAYQVKGVGIHQLEPGMTLGTAIFSKTGTKLFSVNTLLTKDAIDKIKKYNREYPVEETVYIRA